MNTEIKNSILTTDKDADSIVNLHAWKGKLDLINIVMIGLSEDIPIHEEKYELHKLLGALLSQIYL